MIVPSLLLLLAAGCSCRGRPEPEAPAAATEALPPLLAGRVVGGAFVDDRWGFTLPVPEGWQATPGRDDGLLRVTLTHDATSTRVELWAFEGPATVLRPRGDCTWDFVDTARYRALGLAEPVTTGTCTPDSTGGPLVYGWLLPDRDVSLQAEIHVPKSSLVDGRRAGEAVVRGLGRSR